MMKAKTVAMIGALLLGSSALALAQTGSSSTTSPSSGAATGSTAGSTTGGTSGSNTRSVTGGTTGSTTGGTTGSMTGGTTGSTTGSATGSATTTPGPQSAMKTDQDVTKKLQDAGYSNVTDVKPGKNGYTASAMKNGKRVRVAVDANGKIEAVN
jgi:hypothetical protein